MSALSTADNTHSTQPGSPAHCQDSLDSVLPTTLDGLDDGFCELVERRIAWWDSAPFKSWISDQGYSMYQRVYHTSGEPSDTVFPPEARQQDTSFPYAHHGGPVDDAQLPLNANTGDRVCLVLFFSIFLIFNSDIGNSRIRSRLARKACRLEGDIVRERGISYPQISSESKCAKVGG